MAQNGSLVTYKDRAYQKQKSPARNSYKTIFIIFVELSSNIPMKSMEEKLHKHIFVDGEGEPLDKQFVYHYDTDEDDRLILGDGSDE